MENPPKKWSYYGSSPSSLPEYQASAAPLLQPHRIARRHFTWMSGNTHANAMVAAASSLSPPLGVDCTARADGAAVARALD
mmetsp:Transcript_6763/g.20502  ORF Transcript_6763/g.20502 Transcript_6763/m.20502 type:complete len:81 (-) Transcript_6763:1904-2146(-)